MDHQSTFLALVDEIEAKFPVTDWRFGDVPAWPLARKTLYGNLFRQEDGRQSYNTQSASGRRLSSRILRALDYAATPITNVWRSRGNLHNLVLSPRRSEFLFLGDGTTIDQIGGAGRDRYCDPLISHLQTGGHSTFLMQRGESKYRTWSRPTFAANGIINRAHLAAPFGRISPHSGDLEGHGQVLEFLDRKGVPTYELDVASLSKVAASISASARGFERLLTKVRPSICFIVRYYVRMGHAFALACRRQGILLVELQREGRGARHEAYHWYAVPEVGYSILPGVFWTWTADDAAAIDAWCRKLKHPWHRSLYGGHPQLSAWFDDNNSETIAADARIRDICARRSSDLDILVALQSADGYDATWNALATLIEESPPSWRWWLRRHPATMHLGARGLGRLLEIESERVLIDEASSLPLPALLRHVNAFVTLYSGAAVEASMFGLKPIFLLHNAAETYAHLIDNGRAEIIDDLRKLRERLAGIRGQPNNRYRQPSLVDVFARLQEMAREYSVLNSE